MTLTSMDDSQAPNRASQGKQAEYTLPGAPLQMPPEAGVPRRQPYRSGNLPAMMQMATMQGVIQTKR